MKRYTQTFLKFLLLMFCMVPSPAEAVVSCSEYTERNEYSSLSEIIPPNLPEEKKCELIPDECGYTGLIFNPKGMQTSYFKSECYYDIAIKRLDKTFCDLVVERKSLIFNGSYYSPESCRKKIDATKADIAAPKMDPRNIHVIQKITPVIKDGIITVTVDLINGTVGGYYTLAVSANYGMTSASWNPNGVDIDIKYDRKFERFHPLNHWILHLDKDRKSFVFTSDISRQIDDLKEASHAELTIELQFIQSDDGIIADMKKQDSYISRNKVYLNID